MEEFKPTKKGEEIIFKKPSQKPNPEEPLNEIKRDMSFINSKNERLIDINLDNIDESTPTPSSTTEEIRVEMEKMTERLNKELGL